MLVPEINPASDRVMGDRIDVDVRDLAAELPGVLAHQIRDTVLKVVIGVAPAVGTVMPGTQFLKTHNVDIRQPTKSRYARVDGVARPASEPRAVGESAAVVGSKGGGYPVEAKPGIVHQTGIRGPNPVVAGRVCACLKCVQEGSIQQGMVFPIAGVVAYQQRAVERVLAVDVVVDFRHPVVAYITVWEITDVVYVVRGVSRKQVAWASACHGCPQSTSRQGQAYRAHRPRP